MKQIIITSISDNLKERIAAYGDTSEYLNKKADFADALGFVAGQMAYDNDTEKWRLIGALLSEYQKDIDLFHNEAREQVHDSL